MADTPLASAVRHLHRLAGRPPALDVSDAHLLQQYISRRDDDAFAALVRRHGPLVWRVCRRVLPLAHRAEDAYQAVFLVLARRAAKIRKPAALASWLYAVAYRIARQARTDLLREQAPQGGPVAAPVADPACEAAWRELECIVVEEVHALPEKYRLPVLLCYWEGLTNEEAAARLRWPAGTLKTRLLKARRLLHERLTRRGVSLSAGALATLLAVGDGGAVPPCSPRSMAPSRATVAMADGAVRAMTALRVKVTLALLLGSALATGAAVLGSPKPQPTAAERPAPKQDVKPATRADRHGDPLPPGAVARLGTIRWRHGGLTTAVQFAPDGRSLFTMGLDGLRTWDALTGRSLHRLENRDERYLNPGILSADGKRVVTLDPNRKENLLRLWDVPSGRLLREFGDHPCLSGCYSPDGRLFATLGTCQSGIPRFRAFIDAVSLWDLTNGRRLLSWKGHKGGAFCGLFTADGKTLVTGGADKTIRFWDVSTGREKRCIRGEPAAVGHLVLSPDERLLATIGLRSGDPSGSLLPSGLAWHAGDCIVVRDVATGEEVRRLSVPPPKQAGVSGFTAACFTPDGKRLVTGGVDHFARLWDVASGEEVRRYDLGQPVWSLALSPDGKALVALPGGTMVRVLDVASGEDRRPPEHPQSAVRLTALTPDARTALTVATGDGTIVLWNVATGRERHRLGGPKPFVADMLVSRDGRTLYSFLYADRRIVVWDLLDRKPLRELARPPALKSFVPVNALSPEGQTLAVADRAGASVYLLATKDGENRRQLDGHKSGVSRLVFPADGRSLVVTCEDGSVHIWDLAKATKRLALPPTRTVDRTFGVAGIDTVAVSDDGRLLAHVRADRSLVLSDLIAGKLLHTIAASERRVIASTFAFSPDGRTLAWTGSLDPAIHLVEVATGQERRQFAGHQGTVSSLTFSTDGRTLVSGSADTTALVWDVTGQRGERPASADLDVCWAELAHADAARAYQAMGQMTSAPAQTVADLRKRLHAVTLADKEHVLRLVRDLESEAFGVRQKAADELRRLGERAEPALRTALQGERSLEARKRIEELLESVAAAAASPEGLRQLRAVEVLEHIDTSEARDVLRNLASGASEARLTREAKASLGRLDERRSAQP